MLKPRPFCLFFLALLAVSFSLAQTPPKGGEEALWQQLRQSLVNQDYATADEALTQLKVIKADLPIDQQLYLQAQEASLLRARGKTPEALSLLEETRDACRTLTPINSFPASYVHSVIGMIYHRQGRADSAAFYFKTGVALGEEETEKKPEWPDCLMSYGIYYADNGQPKDAMPYYLQALEAFDALQIPEDFFLARLYSNLGSASNDLTDYEQAEIYLKRSLAMIDRLKGGDFPAKASPLINISNTQLALGKHQAALDNLRAALRLTGPATPQNARTRAIIFINQSLNYLGLGQLKEAEAVNLQAIALLEQLYGPVHPLTIQAYLKMGSIKGGSDKKAEAAWYQKALAAVESPGVPAFFRITTLENIGRNLYSRGAHETALPYFRQAKALLLEDLSPAEKAQQDYRNVGDKRQLIWILWGEAFCQKEIARNTLPDSLPLYEAALANYETCIQAIQTTFEGFRYEASRKGLLRGFLKEVYEEAIWLNVRLYEQTAEVRYANRAFTLTEQNKSLYLLESIRNADVEQFAGIPAKLVTQEQGIAARLTQTKLQLDQLAYQAEVDSVYRDSLQRSWEVTLAAYDSLMEAMETRYPSYYRIKYEPQPLALGEVQAQLADSQMLVEYYAGREFFFCFTVGKQDLSIRTVVRSAEMDQQLSDFLGLLSNKTQVEAQGNDPATRQAYLQLGHELRTWLLPPSLPDQVRSLIVIPDGQLAYLPFGLLPLDSLAGEQLPDWRELPYVFRAFDLQYAYSATYRFGVKRPERSARAPFAGIAPQYNGELFVASRDLEGRYGTRQLGALKYAEAEVKEIAQAYGGEARTGAAASEAWFKTQASDYQILHLAMHALLDPEEPMFSGLAFSGASDTEDNFLHAYEIYGLDLSTELVVLSACNTGQGQIQAGEGVMSLARAFSYAGCPNVLMSLWQADDQATATLMAAYHQFLQAGRGKSEALRLAQEQYLESQDLTHPYYWSAFVLMGEDSPLQPLPQNNRWWYLLIIALAGGLAWFGWRGMRTKE
ncbi:MAG: CHAT domain-containing tetratricopeptide repeat protein [Bacteroidota bacterium]